MMVFAHWLLWLVFIVFGAKRLMTYLHIFQQDDYDPGRFARWIVRARALDRKVSAALAALSLMALLVKPLFCWALAIVAMIVFAGLEKDPRKTGKKPLVLTVRASRTCLLAWGLAAAGSAAILALATPPLWSFIVAVQALPFCLVFANALLMPFERHIQKKYWNEAHARLLAIHPVVIGVTGSFGKTSVKHLLGHVLKTHARTYYTQGSINSPMGISRAIREEMPADCRYFVSEMGAYGIGSIARVCALTPPQHGIITVIGDAHYERFKSLNNVAKAKFELAEAVVKADGKMVAPESVLEQPHARAFIGQNRARFLMCGSGDDVDVKVGAAAQTARGTGVDVTWQGKTYRLEAPLWGNHQAQNIALVFTMGVNLGLSPEQIAVALKSAPQTKHRLEVKPQADGSIYIDDAYNSNFTGFVNALDTLTLLCPTGGRRILVTPGMAELGTEHDAQHAKIAAYAAAHVDVVLVVKPERIPTFVAGLAPSLGQSLIAFANFSAAGDWLKANVRSGDIVLLENDLPDLYEKKLSL